VDQRLYDAKRREMIAGFFQTMLLASEAEVDGERHAYINSTIAIDAIVHLLAAIIESRPDLKTRQDIRKETEAIEKQLRTGVETLRKTFNDTGQRAMPTILGT
jgi:hypothetical protein